MYIVKGLCIEANPMYWRVLTFRNCQVVGAAIGHNRMEKVQFSLNEEFSGIVGADFDNKAQEDHPFRKKDGELEFYTVPLLEVFQRNQVPTIIDYLSLDVEGAEYFVMQDFPFEQYTMCLLTIERPRRLLRELLESRGYRLLKIISKWGETLWVHESMASSLDESVFSRFRLPRQDIAGAIPE
jgi:hypothetical protein